MIKLAIELFRPYHVKDYTFDRHNLARVDVRNLTRTQVISIYVMVIGSIPTFAR